MHVRIYDTVKARDFAQPTARFRLGHAELGDLAGILLDVVLHSLAVDPDESTMITGVHCGVAEMLQVP